jgi:iron complex transport system substrate-binding protein
MKMILPAVIAALALAGTALAADITVKHAQGETTLAVPPKTVLTYDIATLDTLDALGVDIAGLPGTNLPAYLAKYGDDRYLKVGSLFEPDYEAVAAAQPDLVVVAGRSSRAYGELSKLAPTIDLSNDWPRFADAIKENSRTLGAIFDKSAEVEAMIKALDEKIDAIRAKAPGAGKAMVLLTNAAEVTTYGPSSRFGWIFDTLGFTPATGKIIPEPHGDIVSFEYILEADPDWIFVIDRDSATGTASSAAILDNELVNEVKAVRQGHVVSLDPVRAYIVNGGLPAFTALVDQVAAALGE